VNLWIIAVFLVGNVFGQVWIVPRKQRQEYKESKKQKVINDKIRSSVAAPKREDLPRISNEISDFIDRASNLPAVWDFTVEYDFKTASVLKGRLLNSIVSTNLESPLVVEVEEGQGFPDGTIFSCSGTTKHKRVIAACNRVITPGAGGEEYIVSTSLLNRDGSSGLKADYYYSGKEEMVAGTVAAAFARGIIETAQDRVATPLGQMTPDTVKNRYLNGVLGSTDQLTSVMQQEMRLLNKG
jgi:hypothetical protein